MTAVLLACASLGLIGFKIGPLPLAQSFRGTPASITGEQVLAGHFPAGAGKPVSVIGNASAAAPLPAAGQGRPGLPAGHAEQPAGQLGLSALAFRYLFGFAGADTSTPLFVFVFLVALGIDYNIFLMTRVREESARSGTHRGALTGLAATGGVITSAGLVLAGTFAMLATLPLVTFTEIGFTVALGVLLDTIIVRSVLVTALNLDIGRHTWWPSRLARRSVEESSSARSMTPVPWAPGLRP